jgi:hypothetical protein
MDGGERRDVAMPGSSRELKSTRTRRRKTTPPHQAPATKQQVVERSTVGLAGECS